MVEIINESSPNAQVVEIDMPMGEVPPAVEELHSEDESLVEEISNGIPPQESDALDEKRKLLLEGPLSHKPSTRFRQMLARPGIIVSYVFRAALSLNSIPGRPRDLRWDQCTLRIGSWLRLSLPKVIYFLFLE